jgi:hypothetical protein
MYQLIRDPITGDANESVVLRAADGVYIPLAKGNTDYAAYEAWLAQGNTPEAPEVGPSAPDGPDEPESSGDESDEPPE